MTVTAQKCVAQFRLFKYSLVVLCSLSLSTGTHANDSVVCGLELLEELGWETGNFTDSAENLNAETCQHDLTPRFNTGRRRQFSFVLENQVGTAFNHKPMPV